MHQLINQLKKHYLALSVSERRTVLLGSTALLVLVIYQSWYSFNDNLNQLQQRVDNQQHILAWMKQASAEVKSLQKGQVGDKPEGKQFLLSLVDTTIKQNSLSSALQKVQPEGQHGVQVWLEQAGFDKVINWLDVLQYTHGFAISNISVEGQDKNGIVNVRVLIESL